MKKYKKIIEELGLEYKKEIIKLFLISSLIIFISVLSAFLLDNLLLIAIGLILTTLFILFYLSRYKDLKAQLVKDRVKEFVDLFTFFEIFISNNLNVYNSLEKIIEYSSPYLNEKLTLLLKEIDEDKSVQPYINFSNNFESLLIEEVMVSIYQLVDHGNDSNYFSQFDLLFSKISSEEHIRQLENKYKKLDMITSTPLVGAAMITIIITIGIITVIGGVISGI